MRYIAATVQRTPDVRTTLVVMFVSVTLDTEKKAHDASVSCTIFTQISLILITNKRRIKHKLLGGANDMNLLKSLSIRYTVRMRIHYRVLI